MIFISYTRFRSLPYLNQILNDSEGDHFLFVLTVLESVVGLPFTTNYTLKTALEDTSNLSIFFVLIIFSFIDTH